MKLLLIKPHFQMSPQDLLLFLVSLLRPQPPSAMCPDSPRLRHYIKSFTYLLINSPHYDHVCFIAICRPTINCDLVRF